MSKEIPDVQAVNNAKISKETSHSGSPIHKFLIPSPVPTRRNRTYSQTEQARKEEVICKGVVKEFCRQKGHGFITEKETGDPIFVHISDIDGEYVPTENDEVTFKLIPLPYSNTKKQAVHVRITHLAPGLKHETWNSQSTSPTIPPRT